MHDHVDPCEGGLDRGKVPDVGLVTSHPGHGATVETAHLVSALVEMTTEGRADEAGEPCHEDDRSDHAVNLA